MIHYISTNGIGNAWIAAELQVLERKGIPFALHALRAPHQNFFKSPWHHALNCATRVLYPVPFRRLACSLACAPLLFRARFFAVFFNAFFGKRESLRIRAVGILHAMVACDWARSLRKEKVDLVHAQWIQSSGTVGMYGAWLLDVPFSFTGHAADLFRERCALEDKVRRANFIVCISKFHREFYKSLGARNEQLQLIYCGIDVNEFDFRPRVTTARPKILSVGRLVEKKGLSLLIDACRILLDRGLEFECIIAGEGPLEKPLREQVDRLELADRVSITGKPLLQAELPDFLATGSVFAQPCVWARDNDVDGIPRTLMEAMACGIPSISTRLVGIPDLIETDDSGLLVEPGSVVELANATERLLRDPTLAARLARRGRVQIEQKFQIDKCLEPLAQLFRSKLEPHVSVAGDLADLKNPCKVAT